MSRSLTAPSYVLLGICAAAFIADLVAIFFVVHIWGYRKHKFIQSRSPPLTYSVLWIFFSLLLLAVVNSVLYALQSHSFWDITYFFVVNDGIQYGCTLAYATRAWILFYHIEWSYERVNNIWRTQLADYKASVSVEVLQSSGAVLDEHASEEDAKLLQKSAFWEDNRESLGNWKKVLLINMCLILPVLLMLLDVLPFVILRISLNVDDAAITTAGIVLRAVQCVLLVVVFGIAAYLIHRISQISDVYHIGQELVAINTCFTFVIIVGRLVDIGVLIGLRQQSKVNHIVVLVASCCTVLSTLFALYFSSVWVLRGLFNEFAGNETMRGLEKRQCMQCCLTLCLMKKAEKTETQRKKEIEQRALTLNRVLQSQIGFETFTQFLISELSVENILFLVEVKQYKARCRQYHKRESGLNDKVLPLKDEDSRTVPLGGTRMNSTGSTSLSVSVPKFNQKNLMSLRPTTTTRESPNIFKSKSIMKVDYVPTNSALQALAPFDYAMYIYNKYVADGSDLQINIPSKTRKALTKFLIKTERAEIERMHDHSDQMFKLYDKAWEQIHALIDKDSFSRFKHTKQYEAIWSKSKQEDEERSKRRAQQQQPNQADFLYDHRAPTIFELEFDPVPITPAMVDVHSAGMVMATQSIPEEAELSPDEEEDEAVEQVLADFDKGFSNDFNINDVREQRKQEEQDTEEKQKEEEPEPEALPVDEELEMEELLHVMPDYEHDDQHPHENENEDEDEDLPP